MSIVGVHVGRTRAVAWSDSRMIDGKILLNDSSTKMFQAGEHSVCGFTGAGFSGPSASGYILGKVEALCSDPQFADSPRELLLAIQGLVHSPLRDFVASRPSKFAWLAERPGGGIVAAFVLRRDFRGAITLLELDIPLMGRGGAVTVGESRLLPHKQEEFWTGDYFQGGAGCDLQGKADRVNADCSEPLMLAQIDRLYADLRSETETIGGPIDICSIDSNGVKWLRKKPYGAARDLIEFSSVDSAMETLAGGGMLPSIKRDATDERYPLAARIPLQELVAFIESGALRSELQRHVCRGGVVEMLMPAELLREAEDKVVGAGGPPGFGAALVILQALAGSSKMRGA